MYQNYIDACAKDGQKIERLIRIFYRTQPHRRVFVDGGANTGWHTTFAAGHFSHRVIGIEASPITYVDLVKRLMAAAPSSQNCEIFPLNAALGHRETQGDTAAFFYSPTHPGRSTVNTKMWDQWGKGEVEYEAPIMAPIVEIDDLAHLFGGGQPVDFIKLDLEGNEINALRGAQAVIKSDRPNMVIEFGLKPNNEELFGETLQGFADMLKDWGYRAFAPWGVDVSESMIQGYPFWYVFLLPENDLLAQHVELLKGAFEISQNE